MALFLLLLIWPIRSQSVLQAIKFGIELDRAQWWSFDLVTITNL